MVTFGFSAFFPGALQLYFLTTSLFAMGQSYLFTFGSFRSYVGMNVGPPKIPDPQAVRQRLRTIDARNASSSSSSSSSKDVSSIDRMVESIKKTGKDAKRDAKEQFDRLTQQQPKVRADGTPFEGPRLKKEDLAVAHNYERRRRQEDDWAREEKNRALRAAYENLREREVKLQEREMKLEEREMKKQRARQ